MTGPRRPRYVETQERKISGTKGRGRRRGLRDTHHSMANTVAGKNGKKRVPEGVRRPARAARVYSAVTASLPRALQKVVEEDKNMNSAYQRTDFDYEADFAPDFGTQTYVFQSENPHPVSKCRNGCSVESLLVGEDLARTRLLSWLP